MKVGIVARDIDRRMTANTPVNQERLTFEIFKKVHGNAPASQEEAAAVRRVPDGFSVWKTERGQLLVIRDE